jgi:uncharacterized surface protein with fasciclin (FAS1) repeats
MKDALPTLIATSFAVPAAVDARQRPHYDYEKHHEAYNAAKNQAYGQYHQFHKYHAPEMKRGDNRGPGYHNSYSRPYQSGSTAGDNMYLHLPRINSLAPEQAASGAEPSSKDSAAQDRSTDLFTTAAAVGQFNTLIEAVKASGLQSTLTGPDPFTVFAPTDQAFAKLPESILKAITENPQALIDLLTSHIVPGRVSAAAAASLDSAKSVQGSNLSIDTSDGVTVNGAKVITTDIKASNGIIHVIDSVIFPQS